MVPDVVPKTEYKWNNPDVQFENVIDLKIISFPCEISIELNEKSKLSFSSVLSSRIFWKVTLFDSKVWGFAIDI